MTAAEYLDGYGDNPETRDWIASASDADVRSWARQMVPSIAQTEGIVITDGAAGLVAACLALRDDLISVQRANEIADEIEDREFRRRGGGDRPIYYTGGSEHNDYRLAVSPCEDRNAWVVSDGVATEIVAPMSEADWRQYVCDWIDATMPESIEA